MLATFELLEQEAGACIFCSFNLMLACFLFNIEHSKNHKLQRNGRFYAKARFKATTLTHRASIIWARAPTEGLKTVSISHVYFIVVLARLAVV